MSETEKIEQYVNLLLAWNNKFNLIGKSTINDIYNRHIHDSGQLLKFLTDDEKSNCECADFGTGAGLPGIVLSILGIKNMTLIEKSPLKCKFLNEAVKISDNRVNVINADINNLNNIKFDIIFSRALANLSGLLKIVKPFLKENTKCMFLKGKKIKEEIYEAEKIFKFKYELFDSETSSEGKIIMINF
jgi:16S rRNA (guanine527-N7)-methyltransferase